MNNPPHGILLMLVAMIGALVPEVVRLYGMRERLHQKRFSYRYFVISAIYAACAGILALILPATTIWAAFYVGATFPVTMSAILKRGANSNENAANSIGAQSRETPEPWPDSVRTHARGI